MARLYVGNLNSNISKQRLTETFLKHGPIADVWYNSDKCYAFVEFEHAGDAQTAIRQLNKSRLLGLELKVELSKYKRTGSPVSLSGRRKSESSQTRLPIVRRAAIGPDDARNRLSPIRNRTPPQLRLSLPTRSPVRSAVYPRTSPPYRSPRRPRSVSPSRGISPGTRILYGPPPWGRSPSPRGRYPQSARSPPVGGTLPPLTIDLSKPLDIGRTKTDPAPAVFDPAKPLIISSNRPKAEPPAQSWAASAATSMSGGLNRVHPSREMPPGNRVRSPRPTAAARADRRSPRNGNPPSLLLRSSSRDRRSPPRDRRSPPRDRRSPPRDRRSPPRDRRSPPRDRRSPTRVRRSPPRDRHSSPRDRRSPPRDRRSPPRDRRSPPRDRHSPPRDRRSPPRDRPGGNGGLGDKKRGRTPPIRYTDYRENKSNAGKRRK